MDQPSKIQKSLIEELGLGDLPEDKKNQLAIKMTEVILKRIFLETMERLSEEKQEEYEKLVTGGASSREVEQFLQSNIKDYDEMVKKVVDDFKEEMKKQ